MKLSASNICWEEKYDEDMYRFLSDQRIALEAVPSRIFKWEDSRLNGRPISPFEKIQDAVSWYRIVHRFYGLDIASMHSLLYKIEENLFATATYRRYLTEYLKSAVRFAVRIGCPNLCFGAAQNRNIPPHISLEDAGRIAVDFFKELADYAWQHRVCLSIEPLPEKYGTNFIHYTYQAFDLVKAVNSLGLQVDVDLGTVMTNQEDIREIFTEEHISMIHHVHFSEPDLGPIQERDIYAEAAELLKKCGYRRFVSLKMLEFPDVTLIQGVLRYFRHLTV